MIDTINLSFKLKNPNGEYLGTELYGVLCEAFTKIPNCDITKENHSYNSISVKLSYPRQFYITNAYLISTKEECLTVNKTFIANIRSIINELDLNRIGLLEWFDTNVLVDIIRVDVAFTYLMKEIEVFHGYRNIYMILSQVYSITNAKSIPKDIGVLGTAERETLIYADTPNIRAYKKKITIYNQYKKFHDYYANSNQALFDQTLLEHPDLKQRMRIEASKRIHRKEVTPFEFANFDIFSAYVPAYAKYILDNMFDPNIVEIVYVNQINRLKELLIQERNYPNFTYQAFVYRYINEIWDYEMIRIAVMETSPSLNTGYQATSTIKGVLDNYQQQTGIICFGVGKKIDEIRNIFLKCGGR